MLIVCLLISIALIVTGIIWDNIDKWAEDGPFACKIIGTICAILTVVIMMIAINDTVSIPVTEQKIIIYEEENNIIEQEVKTIIESYMKYEEDIYKDINLDNYSDSNLLLLTQLYPELKANALIQTQIDLHISNTAEIKKLKEKAINAKVWAWWLYFKPVGGVSNDR